MSYRGLKSTLRLTFETKESKFRRNKKFWKNKRKKSTEGLEKPEGQNTGCRLIFEEIFFGNFFWNLNKTKTIEIVSSVECLSQGFRDCVSFLAICSSLCFELLKLECSQKLEWIVIVKFEDYYCTALRLKKKLNSFSTNVQKMDWKMRSRDS